MLSRLIANWVYGGSMAGVMLLILLPVFSQNWSVLEMLNFLHLPAYMLHQWEEHDADRFRLFVNKEIGQGRDVLSPFAVFIINIPGVWGVLSATILLTHFAHPGFALIAVWVVLINGLAHVGQAITMKQYNPGLITAALFFLPLSIVTYQQLWETEAGSIPFQMTGLVISLAIHAAIIRHVIRYRQRPPATRY
jgi:Protein of unknown function with HXXEE motif